MSTKLNDFPAAVHLGQSLAPAAYLTSLSGTSVDLAAGDGPVLAVLAAGEIDAGVSAAIKIQESADQATWVDVAGAVFPTVTATGVIHTLRFDRTCRYVRCSATVTGGGDGATVCVLIGQQRKLI